MYRKSVLLRYIRKFQSAVMSFSCFGKKRTKRSRHREGTELSRSRAPKPSFPMYPARPALSMALEHLNLDPVWAKSVPTFLPKG